MMRFLLLILLIFPLFVFSEPGKVVGVIPVKFNSKGMHAPVPYSQQLMDRGWTRVPTLNLPFTYAGGAGQNPRYQPTKVTKKSFARGLGYLAGRAANMTPASKALLIAYGAYEANCISQNYPSLCVDGDEEDTSTGTCPQGTSLMEGIGCTISAKEGVNYKAERGTESASGQTADVALTNFVKVYTAKTNVCKGTGSETRSIEGKAKLSGGPVYYSGSFTAKFTCTWTQINPVTRENETLTSETTSDVSGIAINPTKGFECPIDGPAWVLYDMLISTGPDSAVCAKPFEPTFKPVPVTPEWIEEQDAKDPTKLRNSDVGLDDFVDWETGLPRPDAFEEPTYDPVSPAFADAAEAIANGTVQHDNPNGNGYVPREMMPNLLVQINNWHEGNTFIDVFTGKEVKPDDPPPEESKIDWTKFPGITKAQYEASNNSWGNAATKGAPSVESEIDKFTQEQDKLTDFINEPPPANPFEITLLDLIELPTSNGCRGFTVTGSINGVAKPIVIDQHCPPYDAWGRPVVNWLISIYTLLQCFHIFRRTLEVTP